MAVAQGLFHARGYDAVSVAHITEALGINPPSFYAAFGSKAALYTRVLAHYSATEGVPLAEILRPGRPVAEALSAVLEDAARRYGANTAAAGCLAIEGTRCNDPDARNAARALTSAGVAAIREFVAATHPESAGRLADYVGTMMSGLSAMAREGHGIERLVETARLGALAVERELCASVIRTA
ncbi:TetR/AcrR family transcriptional regulator [Roseococcus sp. YIM B11640]|uniref:TetR/AcrR family transcriptional regulator n=1 Tax=Roseococcus sp. YIM B11640 TaxID=3133973 RepID=UPI003C7BB4FE